MIWSSASVVMESASYKNSPKLTLDVVFQASLAGVKPTSTRTKSQPPEEYNDKIHPVVIKGATNNGYQPYRQQHHLQNLHVFENPQLS
mmetsp:Transcript_12258/g.29505  ORF Transcript_12258/g.29505 Transcript_12258/m.29505 type:complete len:88 (-) Transcript_12258:176-439(-)